MNTVKVNNQEFEIIEAANDEIETTFVNGQSKEYVSGIGQDKNGNNYDIVWYLDYAGDTLPDDAELWVKDWDTADEAKLMPDGFNYNPDWGN